MGRPDRPARVPHRRALADVAAARAELESRGVEFIHAFDSGVCHNAFFQDPDGNAFLLHHRYAPKGADD